MIRKFRVLRVQMAAEGLTQADIARKLLVSLATISNKMRGIYPWTLTEMYTLMDLLGWPYDRMHELFPKDGIAPKSA
jgi:transcriptional regulator with XRE-family HTH domain